MSASVKFNQLQAFVTATRFGSMRAAARALGMSQPALTKTIQELENTLGTRLFIRHHQGIVLTDCGDTYFRHASLVLEELRIANEAISQRLGQARGRVSLGVGASIAHTIMPGIITQFHRHYPNVQLRVTEGQLVAMINELRQGELDFTVNTYSGTDFDNGLLYEKLMEREYYIVARKGHPLEHARTLAELADCEWVLPTSSTSYYRVVLEQLTNQFATPRIAVTCETLMSCLSVVTRTDMLSALSGDIAYGSLFAPHITVIKLEQPLPNATFYLIQRKDTLLSPMGSQLARLFRLHCQK